jgi:hypothetical protein
MFGAGEYGAHHLASYPRFRCRGDLATTHVFPEAGDDLRKIGIDPGDRSAIQRVLEWIVEAATSGAVGLLIGAASISISRFVFSPTWKLLMTYWQASQKGGEA